MTTMSDLPEDSVEEILSRVELTSLRRVRSTCKTWDALSKTLILGEKAIKKQFMALMTVNNSVCLLRFELHGIRNENYDEDLAGLKQISIPHHRQVKISQVFHWDGLLLCVPTDDSKLLVWNPYLGQTRWLRPRVRDGYISARDMYAVGYDDDNNNRNHKILRFSTCGTQYIIDIFEFRSASWRGFHVNPRLKVNLNKLFYYRKSISLKGNTYFCGHEEKEKEETKNYLVCFYFTRERFGPRLPLPLPLPQPNCVSLLFDVTLSNVGDEKLALLYNHYERSKKIVIWITTKIEPNEVSWTKFLTLDMKPHNVSIDKLWIYNNGRSFFIDEEKKVAVLFNMVHRARRCHMAYIIGEDGYFRSVNMGQLLYPLCKSHRIVCSSYVPSLVQPQV